MPVEARWEASVGVATVVVSDAVATVLVISGKVAVQAVAEAAGVEAAATAEVYLAVRQVAMADERLETRGIEIASMTR